MFSRISTLFFTAILLSSANLAIATRLPDHQDHHGDCDKYPHHSHHDHHGDYPHHGHHDHPGHCSPEPPLTTTVTKTITRTAPPTTVTETQCCNTGNPVTQTITVTAPPTTITEPGSPCNTGPPVTKTITETAPPTTTTEPASQCNTGPIQCCNSVQKAGSDAVTSILGLLGVVIQDLEVLVGLTCDPISVIGAGGNSCSATPVCCEDNTFNGIIAIGCVPVIINL